MKSNNFMLNELIEELQPIALKLIEKGANLPDSDLLAASIIMAAFMMALCDAAYNDQDNLLEVQCFLMGFSKNLREINIEELLRG